MKIDAMRISDEYRVEQEALHARGNYGTASIGYAPLVTEIINRLGITHVLDYGCGRQANLSRHIKPAQQITYQAYDPAVPAFAEDPVRAQMLCCIDVLEHIEPDRLDFVLDHLTSLTEGVAFLSIHTGPAVKTLSDGRNAHLIQQPLEWWLPKLWGRFDIHTVQVMNDHGFYVIGYAKPRLEAPNGDKL